MNLLFLFFPLMQIIGSEPLIVAHRGASDYAPENTIPAFKLAWEQDADAIEGDFYLTKDGEIVCIHDASTARVSEVSMNVKYSTLEELRELEVGSWFDEEFQGTKIPTLSEVLDTVPEGKKIYIEIKCGPEILPKLFEELWKSGIKRDQVVVISFNKEVIQELKKRDPGMKANWLVWFTRDETSGELKPSLEDTLNTLKEIQADGLSSGYNSFDDSLIRDVENAGFEYHVWTVDHLETARNFKKWGALSITTNNPLYMKKYMDKPLPEPEVQPGEPAYVPYSNMPQRKRLIHAKARRGPGYSGRLKSFMNSDYEKGGTVFLGDTLIAGFPLKTSFKDKNVINFGITGDTVSGVTERLDVCIKAVEPEKVYVMAGVHDLTGDDPKPVKNISDNYEKLLHDMKLAVPEAQITVFSLLPVTDSYAGENKNVKRLNSMIRKLSESMGVNFYDLHADFVNDDGELSSYLTDDGVSLTTDGYLVWLKSFLSEEEYREAAVNFSEYWLGKYGGSFPVTQIDPPSTGTYPGSRGPDELIIYTPSYEKSSTNTNQWGHEVIIRNGVVDVMSVSNSPIPEDGYVVSGHGIASEWIQKYLKPGVRVEYDRNMINISDIPVTDMSQEQRLNYLKKDLFRILSSFKKSDPDMEKETRAFRLLDKIMQIQVKEETIDDRSLDEISKEIEKISK